MTVLLRLILLTLWQVMAVNPTGGGGCMIPLVVRGAWFSFEKGKNTVTDIDDGSMSERGVCVDMVSTSIKDITFLFRDNECFHCVRLLVRTVNVIEKTETGCVTFPEGYAPSLEDACRGLDNTQGLTTMFKENPTPKNCRSALEGVWQFAYQNRFSFTGECNDPGQQVRSCQEPGNQFLIANQKFTITYKKCEGIKESFNGVSEFLCLGDWFVGKNHYIAASNTKESRKDEKYRCFVRNRDDDRYMGVSITPECSVLKTPENSPARFRMTPVKYQVVQHGCLLPRNFSGEWINTAHTEGEVTINETHIVETTRPDVGRIRKTIYVCREQRDNRYMMARLNIDGCQTDFVCFEFVPRHHNIIRFRKGQEMIKEDFSTVCSYIKFKSQREWSYNLMLAKDPVPVKCPVAGKFNITQKGEKFTTRILGGYTVSIRDNIYCKENISDFSVCDKDQKEIAIDANYCISVDAYGRHVDIYSDPDYTMSCIGYWKENLKSYLITFDKRDPYSKYRCWVYQRADLNRVMMSQSVGPFCNVHQSVTSFDSREGAAVALYMVEYERERDRCPMHFDDGSNPWKVAGNTIRIFDFKGRSVATVTAASLVAVVMASLFLLLWE
ncbi:protein undicht isoform X2 [Oratosquilla oratoria]|uniref:protein undicht isoform X2 n=1 Tax=Oratosquilla oratoria TaxID=337810 RepID=UPI003F77684A